MYSRRSWKKLLLFEGTESNSLLDIIKSTQRMKLATKVKDEAEVNFDKELPDNKHFEGSCELLRSDADKLFNPFVAVG